MSSVTVGGQVIESYDYDVFGRVARHQSLTEEEPSSGAASSAPEETAVGPDRDGVAGETDEHAVVIHLLPVGDELALDEVEDALAAAVEKNGAGWLDGNETGPAGAAVYLYGADADRVWGAVHPVLSAIPLPPGSHATLRYGGSGARERRVDLS